MEDLAARVVRASKALAAAPAQDERHQAAGELRKLVLQETTQGVVKCLNDAAIAGTSSEYVSALLTGAWPGLLPDESAQDASKCAALRLKAFRHSLSLLAVADCAMTEGQATSLVCSLAEQLGSITGCGDLHQVVDAAVDAFESDAPLACTALDLLPRALSMLQALGVEDAAGPGTASDSCSGCLQRICSHPWPAASIAKVLGALREMPMSAQALRDAVRRAAQRARCADLQDLPAIVHQMLVLAGRGCREDVLEEVVTLFDRLEAAAGSSDTQRRRLMEVEASVLLHIDMAVKHDGDLGQVWVRGARAAGPAWRPSPFALALCFALAGTPRFEQPMIDVLRSLVVAAHRDEAQRAAAAWLPPEHGEGRGEERGLNAALLQCVRNSAHGQAAMVQPVVQLAVALMETGAGGGGAFGRFGGPSAGSPAGAAAAAWYLPDGSLDPGAPPAAHTAHLGGAMLEEIFAGVKESRRDIIALCASQLVGAREEAALPFVRAIATLVRRHGPLMAQHAAGLRSALEQLPLLPPGAALALLLAVWPLCRERRDMRDFAVLLLRKAMFGREVGSRVLAARGFLFLIAEELAQDKQGGPAVEGPSCSQAAPALSQCAALAGGGGGGTLLHELISFLRRCLAQQPEVRCVVYHGLPALLAADPAAMECAVEPLLPHFLTYYERDEALSPPIKLEACVRLQGEGRVCLVEPLQHLLAGLRRVLHVARPQPTNPTAQGSQSQQAAEGGSATDKDAAPVLRLLLTSLRRRMATCPLEDFGIDSSTTFSAADAQGELQQANADILLGCYEALMEDAVQEIAVAGAGGDGARSEELADELLALFRQHCRLSDLAAEGCKGGGRAAGGAGTRGRQVEGLTQAVNAGPKRAAGAAAPGVGLDKRVPVLSVECLVLLVTAIVEDGLVPGGTDAAATQSAHVKLARDVDFQTFVLTACLRALQGNDKGAVALSAAVGAGCAGGQAGEGSTVGRLFGSSQWEQLAAPLFAAAQITLLARCKERVPAAAGAKRERDDSEALTQVAAAALERLLAGAQGGAEGLAALLRKVPPAARALQEEADLPQGSSPALALLAARLPHLKQLLDTAVAHACAKELEQLCSALNTVTAALPPPFAAAVAAWAEAAAAEAPEQVSHHPAAVRALLTLGFRSRAAAGEGADLDALCRLAQEVTARVNAEGAAGATGTLAFTASEAVPLLGTRSVLAVVGAALSHVEASIASLDWALGRLRAVAAAQGAAKRPTEAAAAAAGEQRLGWEAAVFARLRRLVDAAALLAEARLSGPPCEALSKALIKLYRLLGAAAKGQLPAKGCKPAPPCRTFQDLANCVNAGLTPKVYTFISELRTESAAVAAAQENHPCNAAGGVGEDGKAAKAASRRAAAALGRAKRDSRSIPNLIFQMEEFEKHLIRLSKAGRLNLMAHAKRAASRDFRIADPEAKRQRGGQGEGVGAEEAEEEEEGEEEEEEGEEGDDG